MLEIERAMVRVGTSTKLFTLKILTPIYPPYYERLKDYNFYDDKELKRSKAVSDERITKNQLSIILDEL